MARLHLLDASPRDPASAAAVAVALAGGGARAYDTHRLAGIVAGPLFQAALGFADGAWTGGAVPSTSVLAWAPADAAVLSRLAGLLWLDAPLAVRVGDDDTTAEPAAVLTARVAAQAVSDGQLQLTVADLSGDLANPLVPSLFAGTGGIEGDAAAAGRVKRRSWGEVRNVEARVLVDADNVYELGDPARALAAITAVRDKGRAGGEIDGVADQGSPAATLAALRAASVPAGGAVAAPSIACVKWWTKPSGPLTADLTGEGGQAGAPAIAATVVAAASALAVEGLADWIARRPARCGLHVEDASETAAAALDRLLGGVSLFWTVDPASGAIRLGEWALPAAAAAIGWAGAGAGPRGWGEDGAAPVAWSAAAELGEPIRSHRVRRLQTFAPLGSRRVGYAKNHRVMQASEIAAAVLADDTLYADGSSVESLQPAEPAAQVTRSIDVDESALAFSVDTAGDVVAGQLPRQVRATVTAGTADVSLSAEWSVVASAGIAASIDNTASATRGTITVTAVAGPGTLTVQAISGGVYLSRTLSVTTKGALADKSLAGTGDIAAGAVTATASYTAPDVAIGASEVTLIETDPFTPGDEAYGQALALVTFLQDSSGTKDTAATIRIYLDTGSGYQLVREGVQGLRTSGADTYWAFPSTIPVAIASTGPARIKATAQGAHLGGGGSTSGSAARYIRVDVFQGAR